MNVGFGDWAAAGVDAASETIRILHVDDDPGYTDLASELLARENESFEVVSANSPDDGLARLSEIHIDCIVSDYDMPGTTGIDFYERIPTEYGDIPFILFTGKGSEEVASDAFAAGVTDYIQKQPGTDQFELVAKRIQNAVDKARSRRQVELTRIRFQTLVEAATDAIFVVSPAGVIQYATPTSRFIDGRDPEDLVGTDGFEPIHPDDLDRVEKEYANLVADPEYRAQAEFRYRHADGYWTWVSVRGRNLIDDPHIGGIVVYATDITDRKADEWEMTQREEKFRAVFEEAFDAMLIADDDGVYMDANPAACDLFGVEKDDLLGRSIHEFAPAEYDFDAAWTDFQESDRERGMFPLVRADGDRRIVEFAATPNILPNRHLSILRDITDRREREQRLLKQTEQSRAVGEVLRHDLMTPLSTAMGTLELAVETEDYDHLQQTKTALQRMEAIVEDLSNVLQEGQLVNEISAVDLAAVTRQVWETFETGTAELTTEPGTIRADESALHRLLENLLKNALEHGGDAVHVTVGVTERGFFVEDDGPGIAEDERDEVLRPGYSTADSGTGLGLTSVHQIALAHGWTMAVTEGSRGGARFEFSDVE